MSFDQTFSKQFGREVHEAYQRQGSKLRATVRVKNGVRGYSTVFKKDGGVPAAEAQLVDYYAGEWVEDLGSLKNDIGYRKALASASAFALGRTTDELIIQALQQADQIAGKPALGMTEYKALDAFENLGRQDVPNDGQRFAVVGWKQWHELMSMPGFANADPFSGDSPMWHSVGAKNWLGTLWSPHSGLPKDEGARTCFWYHKSAIGHAIGDSVRTDITWHADRAAHFVTNSMSQGAVLVDETCVVKMLCKEE